MRVALLVPDGAADPLPAGPGRTCLEEAATPVLDRLAGEGRLRCVRTVPDRVPPGTEVGLPALLGVPATAAPSRGAIDAAATGVPVGADEGAWRLDVLAAGRAPAAVDAGVAARLAVAVAPLGGRVHRLGGHRFLLIGPRWWGDAPPGPHQTAAPLRALVAGPFAGVAKAARAALDTPGPRRTAWPWGALGRVSGHPSSPAALGVGVTLVAARGSSAAGIGVLLGCRVVDAVPAELPEGLTVVHDAGPDQAAHARDRAAKVRALEAVDERAGRLAAVADVLVVCPDHGCDPATGEHTSDPVPALVWPAAAAGPTRRVGAPGVSHTRGAHRVADPVPGVGTPGVSHTRGAHTFRGSPAASSAACTERAVAGLPVVAGTDLLAGVLRAAGVPA